MLVDATRYRIKIAETDAERAAAQRLRYRVFVEEMGAHASPEQHRARREWDRFDPVADHLILCDQTAACDPLERVVGAYRLIPHQAALTGPGFYSASEFDLGPILATRRPALELGRSCVARGHRGGAAMHLLWNGLADYVASRGIELLFGVASFPGVDPDPIAEALSLLHHCHLAPAELRVQARAEAFCAMDRVPRCSIEERRALDAIPPLIRAYLRLGGYVGEGAWIDRAFNTIDVCVVMDTQRMSDRYRMFYERGRVRHS